MYDSKKATFVTYLNPLMTLCMSAAALWRLHCLARTILPSFMAIFSEANLLALRIGRIILLDRQPL